MNQYTITLVYTSGSFERQTEVNVTDMEPSDLHHIVAEAFFIDEYARLDTITEVANNVWQITMNEAVFIVVKN